jgi:hypothetical protein
LDKDTIRQRLLSDGQAFLEDAPDRPQIEANWEFLFGDPVVPSEGKGPQAKRPRKTGSAKKRKPQRRRRDEA